MIDPILSVEGRDGATVTGELLTPNFLSRSEPLS